MGTVNTEDDTVCLLQSSIFVCFSRANDHFTKWDIGILQLINVIQ